jgi:hypothetical protein
MAGILTMSNPKPLLSDVAFVRLSLAEGTGDRVKVRGEFAKCGIATENRRVYPGPVWEKEIKRLNKALKERRVFGEVDHPSDGTTKLARVSHIVTDLKIKDGLVIGEAEILPTEAGKNLLALMQANVPVGVSSRGFGSVKTNDKNEDVVQEDYKLVTFDFVADPADVDAFPQMGESIQQAGSLFEGVEFDVDEEQEKAIEFARRIESEKSGKKVAKQESIRDEFAREILGNLAKLRAEVRDEVRSELLTDPSIAGAKVALEAVREALKPYILPEDAAEVVKGKDASIQKLQNEVAERDLRIKELESENTALAEMAKEVGYRFFLEKVLSNDPQADAIRTLVGDVKTFDSSDALKERVAEIKAEIAKQEADKKAAVEAQAKEVAESRKAQKAERAEFDARFAKVEKLISAEKTKREELEAALAESQAENEKLKTKLYAEQRLTNHPKAKKLRNLVESSNVEDEGDVDALIESEREPIRDGDELQNIRARIRSRIRDSEAPEAVTEARQVASGKTKKDYLGLGIDIDSLKRLSGISR